MDISELKRMTYEELRAQYLLFLKQQNIGLYTIRTSYTDSFYLWRKGGQELFWKAVDNNDVEARKLLLAVLKENSSGDADKLVSGYLSHLRRFRTFLRAEDNNMNKKINFPSHKKHRISLPKPEPDQVERYLKEWELQVNYLLQEKALNKLFFNLCPYNTDINDILLKVSTLNDFYSTNIYSIYPVAKRILSLNIDKRLESEDVTLVEEIKRVTIKEKEHIFYSFASKYCSHHKPQAYPIYDRYVDAVLRHYREQDGFSIFNNADLKDYVRFKSILIDFQKYYRLEAYDLKQIDKYLWQLGKKYFPKDYKNNR